MTTIECLVITQAHILAEVLVESVIMLQSCLYFFSKGNDDSVCKSVFRLSGNKIDINKV